MTVSVRAGADLRLLRAAVFSAVCVTLSAIGYAMASGAGIPLWTLLAGWAGVLCVAAPLAGRKKNDGNATSPRNAMDVWTDLHTNTPYDPAAAGMPNELPGASGHPSWTDEAEPGHRRHITDRHRERSPGL